MLHHIIINTTNLLTALCDMTHSVNPFELILQHSTFKVHSGHRLHKVQ